MPGLAFPHEQHGREYSSQQLGALVRQVIESFVFAQIRDILPSQLRNQLSCLRVLVVLVNILNFPNEVVDAVPVSREPLLEQFLELDSQFGRCGLTQAWDAKLIYHAM